MAKRISRKLLVGLGSVVTFGAVGTVSGFGVKSIIDSTLNHNQVNQLAQTFPEGSYTELTNYNTTTPDMFIDTTNLKRFHFGTTQTGQKVTPWGWLGVFEDSNTKRNRIALTGWNGEIIWVNNDYANQNDERYNVYDMEYDWNTNLILVLRTKADNGFYVPGSSTVPLQLDILKAKTGEKITNSSIDSNWFKPFQDSAINKLDDNFLLNLNSNQTLKDRSKNLYYLDVSYSPEKNVLLATWMPNYMQMADQTKDAKNNFSLPTFYDVITTWKEAAASAMLDVNRIEQNLDAKYKRQFELSKSAPINKENGTVNIEVSIRDNWVNTKDIYLLANPFFTPSSDGNAFIMHLIGARAGAAGEVIHKSIGWKINLNGGDAFGELYEPNTFDQRAEKWSNNGFLELDSRGSFAKAKGWRNEFINANLRVNKNMFNPNSVVFAYPFATSSHYKEGKMMPSFNVVQVKIDPTTGNIDTKTKETAVDSTINYGFAGQINSYFDRNSSSYDRDRNKNNIYPTPAENEASDNINHSYNRLISVSPFDNTIIYAAKPNIRDDIFDQRRNANKNKWAGFWVANSWAVKKAKGKYYRPLIVSADRSISAGDTFSDTASRYMLNNVNDLYTTGFTFDIRSLVDVNGQKSLNLYFNQTGTGVNDSYGNNSLLSSKIGLLNDVLKAATSSDNNGEIVWVKNVAEKYKLSYNDTAKRLLATGIDKKSYANVIHSRADLKKWYNRSWTNLNRPGNMYLATENNNPKVINESDASSERAVANTINGKLNANDPKINSNNSVDLVSAWLDKDNQTPVNYNRLIFKRPKIRIGDGHSEGTNTLGLATEYKLVESVEKDILKKEGWAPKTNTGNLLLKKADTVYNVSYQIVSSWEQQYKMNTIQDTTDKLSSPNNANWFEVSGASWQDKIINPNLAFGNANNNLAKGGQTPLRLMLKLVKPTGTLPSWFGNNFDNYFQKAFPIVAINNKETSFSDMVKEYANKKASLIDLSDANNAAVSLGNLKIEAYLELNPAYTGSNKIFYNGNSTQRATKRYLQDSSGGIIIYEDLSNMNNHLIYDQSQIEFKDFFKGGFGDTPQSPIRKLIEKSWRSGAITRNFQIKVSTDYANLKDNLVRKSANDNSALFSFDYKAGTNNQIEITPNTADLTWFKNHFQNFNRLLGLFVQFQYKLSGQSNWTDFPGAILTDQDIKTNFQNNRDKLVLSNAPANIEKIRFKLKKGNPNDNNLAIDILNFNENDLKYISAEHGIAFEKYVIKSGQIRTIWFANKDNVAGKTLASVTKADIDNFIEAVVNQSTSSNSAKQKVTLKFNYNNKQNLDSQKLYEEIQNKLNSTEPFTLSNGNDLSNGETIQAFFVLKNPNDSVRFFDENGNSASNDLLTGTVVSNLISEIDLNDYIDQLMNNPLTVTPPPITPGQFNKNASTVKFPTNEAVNGFFAGMTFDQIKTKLRSNLGVVLRFKGYNPQTGLYDNWTEDINSIRFYNPTYPQIIIGFKQLPNWNTKLLKGSQPIQDTVEFSLNLALVKLVKLPQANDITTMISQFNAKNVFSGNTKNLIVGNKLNEAKEIVVNALKNASGPNGYDSLGDKIELVFKLGDFKNNSASDGYFSAELLKQALANHSSDIDLNELKMKVRLKDEKLFTLADDLKAYEFVLFAENNKNIKKYLNGTVWENSLKNNGITIRPGSSRNNLSYDFQADLTNFQTGEYAAKELKLEYQLDNGNWRKGALPTSVATNINTIKIRISSKENNPNDPNLTYVYGPQIANPDGRTILTLNLDTIPTILNVDPSWFTTIKISDNTIDLNSLNTKIQEWENKIWAKVNNNAGVPQELINGVYIKYKLILNPANNQGIEYNDAASLLNGLKAELTKYDSPNHHGIFKLWDGVNSNSGFKIKATFSKKPGFENKIQFQNNGQNIDNNDQARTADVNTANIQSTLDLSAWINNLLTTPTRISGNQQGVIPTNGLIPPVLAGAANSALFAGQTFANIDAWLKGVGINILWNKDPNIAANQWKPTANTTEYDPTKSKLWFALENKSSNLVLKLNPKTNINPGQDNKKSSLEITLDAIKVINVHPTDANVMAGFFGGNTKYLTVETRNIKSEIDKILNKQGPLFANAPLTLMVQVGQEAFVDYTQLQKTLESKQTDVDSGLIQVRFAINPNDPNAGKFQLSPNGGDEFTLIPDNGTIKIFINDQNIFNSLKDGKTTASGSNSNLQINWPNGWTVSADGIFNGNGKGKGLRLEFSFADLVQDAASGTDINKQWFNKIPTSFDPKYTKLYARFQTINNKYVYERIESNRPGTQISPANQDYKFNIDLANIQKTIELDGTWLEVNNFITSNVDLANISENHFQTYETSVNQKINLDPTIKSNIKIIYSFDDGTKLNKQKLVESIKSYSQRHLNDESKNFGILKLWNKFAGQKITATFDDVPVNNLVFTWKDQNKKTFDLDLSKVITTIDLKPVVKWLEQIKVSFNNQGNTEGTIAPNSINFNQNINAAGSPFNNRSWDKSEQILEKLNLKVQYQPSYNGADQTQWFETKNDITKYDPSTNIFKLRFLIEDNSGVNLKVNVKDNEVILGTGKKDSNPININLKAARKITLDNTIINNFIAKNVVSGNTKYLKINVQFEKQLIQELLSKNDQVNPGLNPAFSTAKLQVLYFMGDNPSNNDNDWKVQGDLKEFTNSLKEQTINQKSNKIWFKFRIDPAANQDDIFKVDSNQTFTLVEKNTPISNTNNQYKIPYFIHTNDFETDAADLSVDGTSNSLNWNFSAFGTEGTDYEKTNNELILKADGVKVLQLHFTTKANPQYNEQGFSDDLNQISRKWVNKIPNSIPNQAKLFVRVVPISNNFVYQAAGGYKNENDVVVTTTAKVHPVDATIKNIIKVDVAWMNQYLIAPTRIEIQNFNKTLIDQWITKLRTEIKKVNKVDDTIANQIDLKFEFNGSEYNSAQELINGITNAGNSFHDDALLGIVQLWNQDTNKGLKIKATFVNKDPKNIILKDNNDANDNSNNPSDTSKEILSADLQTKNIYTLIDATSYINTLKTAKTTVTHKNPNDPNDSSITGFNPPTGNNPGGIFDGISYDKISSKLNQIGISIKFNKNSTGGQWVDKNGIDSYIPGKDPKLFLAFYNETNNNIELKLDQSLTLIPNQNNQAKPIGLPLAVPKQVDVNIQDVAGDLTIYNFQGNTRNITFNENADQTIFDKILNRNNIANDVNKPRFILEFQVGGTNYEYKKLSELKKYLKDQPANIDFIHTSIEWRISIDPSQQNDWKFSPKSATEGTLYTNNNSPLKIYVNDQNIFNDLKLTKPTGDNENLVLEWKNGIKIDQNTGVLSATPLRGAGLRIEFTFSDTEQGNSTNVGTDPYKSWTKVQPTKFKDVTKLYLRIKTTSNKYDYDNLDQKITIDLSQIPKKINLKRQWLEKSITNTDINLSQLDKAKFQAYETAVFDAALNDPNQNERLTQQERSQLTIHYTFSGTTYKTIDTLIAAINSYKQTFFNDKNKNYGILQLWNNSIGEKITSKFALIDSPNGSYELNPNNLEYDLDFSKVKTEIDFSKVISWINDHANNKIPFIADAAVENGIKQIQMPNPKTDASDHFNNRPWSDIESVLSKMGISIKYSQDITGQADQFNLGLNSIKKYDPNKGTFKLMLVFDNPKAKNITLKVESNLSYNGATESQTKVFVARLDTKLIFKINQADIDKFIKDAQISGNTKNIILDETKEQELIKKIKNDNATNNNEFTNAPLAIQYYLGDQNPAESDWKKAADFKAYLISQSENNIDQTSNKLSFRFIIDDSTLQKQFDVDKKQRILRDKKTPDQNPEIKYYISANDWETKADKIVISGPSDNLQWNFNIIYNNNFIEDQGAVYLKNNTNYKAIKVYFTLMPNADYDQPGLSNDINEINTKWVSVKPSGIPAGTTSLKIKLVANDGFVYGPAEKSSNPRAKAHSVDIKVQNVIYVDKKWFNPALVTSKIEITALQKNLHFDPWEEVIYNQIVKRNNITLDVAKKIKIKYILNNNRYESQQLINELKRLKQDYAANNLGIIKLWNTQDQLGIKVEAIFESSDQNYIIRTNNSTNNPTDDDIKNLLNTDQIFSSISMIRYLEFLSSEVNKTNVSRDPNNPKPGFISGFTPPQMPGAINSNFLAGRSFDVILQQLKNVGITIEFSKDKTANSWKPKDQIKEYDIQKNALFMAFTINSQNVDIQLTSTEFLTTGQNNKNNPTKLPLNVKKYILINNVKPFWQNIKQDFAFSGTTKQLSFNKDKINEFLNEIKKDNFNNSAGDESYKTAPLEIRFQIGDLDFVSPDELNNYLKSQNVDLEHRLIRIKFEITRGQETNWEVIDSQTGTNDQYEFLSDTDPLNKIKIFINDNGNFNKLKSMKLKGTQDNLIWEWPFGSNVINETNGVLTPAKGGFGKGLKIQFSFKENAATEGADPETSWAPTVPKSFKPKYDKIWLRIKLTNEDLYTYDNINQPFALSLAEIIKIIKLDSKWLNQMFKNGTDFNINQLSIQDLTSYEEAVKNAAKTDSTNPVDNTLIDKFTIKYQFNDQNNWLTKEELINAISDYKNNKSQTSLGILQLWNESAGVKIKSKFDDAYPNDNYQFEYINNTNEFLINTKNVQTEIDFSKVIQWITDVNSTKLDVEPGNAANTIGKIKFPPYQNNQDPLFNNVSWEKIEAAFNQFGIHIEWRIKNKNNTGSFGTLANLSGQQYDPQVGRIQFKIRFDNAKAKNMLLKTDNNPSHPGTGAINNIFDVKLNVKLGIIIDENLVDTTFINVQNVISGDTKNIVINKTIESDLIQKLLQKNQTDSNNNDFANAPLMVQYYLGDQSDKNIQWRSLTDFANNLKNDNRDQINNKVIFRFTIDSTKVNAKDFIVDETKTFVLHNPDPNNPSSWKVKFYINKNKWEENAAKIQISGKTSNIRWDYSSLGSDSNIIKEPANGGHKIFVKINGRKALQVQFSTKKNISYNDPNTATDDINDLNQKWITIQPTKINPPENVKHLYIRLVAAEGFVYQAKEDNSAQAHKIDESQLKIEIEVNPTILKRSLTVAQQDAFITDIKKSDFQQYIDEVLTNVISPDLAEHVVIVFHFNGKTFDGKVNGKKDQAKILDSLFNEIQNVINNKSAPDYGILQLWNSQKGKKIEANYALKDPNGNYSLIDANRNQNNPDDIGQPEAKQIIDTQHIKTLIDLKDIVLALESEKINVNLKNKLNRNLVEINGVEMPAIPNVGTSGLKGLEWNKFEQVLKNVGVLIEARPVISGNNNLAWQPINQINQYDPTTLKLELRFKLDQASGFNMVLSVLADKDVEILNNNLPTFEMTLNAPAQVVVSPNLLTNFVDSNDIKGNTKNITMDKNAENILIKAIIDENIQSNQGIFSQLDGRLEIKYFLGKTASNNENDWRLLTDFESYLAARNQDFDTNKIWYRFDIKDGSDTDQVFQIDQTAYQLHPEQIDDQAKVKIFINDTGFVEKIKSLKAVGATDNFEIQGHENWIKTIPNGLQVGYSNEEEPNVEDDKLWTEQVPNSLNSNKKLWLRFKTEAGYVFEKAKQNPPGTYSKYSEKYSINTNDLKLVLKLEKQWLNQIVITGNTSESDIQEDQVLEKIKDSGILPTGQDDLIVLEYSIIGTNKWMKKNEFINKLKELKGAKDDKNFILKREELIVRFALKDPNGNYGLNIDGNIISDDNRDQFNVQMVNDDQNQNSSFEGYINVDKLKEFTLNNFEVKGTTSSPRLIIKDRTKLDTLLSPYVSDELFDIQFAYKLDNKNEWIWETQNSILDSQGRLIDEQGLIKKGVQIGANRKFALRFVTKNPKYSVYKDNQKEDNGYLLDISQNVKIVVEITNPFTAANKTLGLWTRDENNKGKYYQGEGGFKIITSDLSTLDIDKNNTESAQQFLKNAAGLQDNEKNALEFVYHIFGSSASSNEIESVKKTINDYDSDDWKIFNKVNKTTDEDWSGNLGLKVGDYVAVAIRVKQEFSTGDNAFVLKNDDYSMILPQMIDTSNKPKTPGRVAGYKIKTDQINVDDKSVVLSNMVNAELPPLDGWTWLSKLNLNKDQAGNYLGVDLKLQLYTDYYTKTDGGIWISGSGAKLVKREQTNSSGTIYDDGTYKDSSGNEIKDTNQQPIKIYKDKTTNRLSNPTKNSNVTVDKMLVNLGEGAFRLEIPTDRKEEGKLSLFKNQDIELKLVARQGLGTTDLPDYYLDNEDKIINLRSTINPEIKYPIENESKITYEWNYDDFVQDKISYDGINNKLPEDGAAKIKTIFKLFKKQGSSDQKEVITGTTPEDAVKKLNETLEKDFKGQLQFETTRLAATGTEAVSYDNNIYKFNDLRNKDRIIVKIVAKEDDLYYAEAPRPLIINVRGLTEAAPDQNKLQHLRVKQGGKINGQGSFKVLVSNPNDDDEDDRSILKGWKFMIRVWSKDLDETTGKHKIKINWTDDQASVKNLENGDKVEWKLVSEDGNPVKEAYYNTIALEHQLNDDGSIKYNFAQIQYQNGDSTYTKVKEGIGDYPENDEYPQDSGFIISGLKSAIETFKISKENFAKVIAQLQPSYVGINTQGTIHFSQKYFDENYWVNTNGELYVKKDPATFKDQSINEIGEIPLTEFLDHVTFYTHDPVIANYQGGFKFSGNDININNHLTNGDQMWATFDITKVNDDSGLIVNDPTTSVVTQLLDVSGLKDIIDPMSPLWYVLMALAGIATLGTAALIAFLVARHKKLKGKN